MTSICASTDFINLVVGGLNFCLSVEDINYFPGSYFSNLVKDEWNEDKSQVIHLNRDGRAFRFVHYYIYTGFLDTRRHELSDLDMLLAVKREADYYNLPRLVALCDVRVLTLTKVWCRTTLPHCAPFSVYHCVSEGAAPPEDALTKAVCPIRPAGVATARLVSYLDDHVYNFDMNRFLAIVSCASYRSQKAFADRGIRCTVVGEDFLSPGTWKRFQGTFVRWPLHPHQSINITYCHGLVLTAGESIYKATQILNEESAGTILYIFNSAFTGGTVSTTVNGQTVSINQPGECIALIPGCLYSVDTVTSGVMILLEMDAMVFYDPRVKENYTLSWTKHSIEGSIAPPNYTMCSAITDNLVRSVDNSLKDFSGVVLCLTQYYTVRFTEQPNRRFETDPAELVGLDAALYTLLTEHFEVSVVSVYISRVDNCQRVLNACIADFVPAASPATNDSTGNLGDELPCGCESGVCERVKIVSPLYGYGECFRSCVPAHNCPNQQDSGDLVWCSLLTGLLVMKK